MSAESKKNIVKSAMIYSQEGKWKKAITEYKKLLTLDPTDYNVHNMLGDAYAKKGDDELAYSEYMTAAEAYLKQGLSDKVGILYKKIGRLNSEKLGEEEKKKQLLIKKHTTAEKLIENGEIDKAIETYKEILKLSPANFDTYQKLGELYTEKGQADEALTYYKKIVDIYFKNRLYKKALPIYRKILEIQPDNISIREKIAEIYERERNETEAKREYVALAEYYWKEQNIEKTDYFSRKAVEFKSIEAHFYRGAALYKKKEYDEAKKELNILLKFKANHTEALLIMADLNRKLNKPDDAMKMYDKIAKARPDNSDAYTGMGELYLEKGMKKEAAAKYMLAANVFSTKQDYENAAATMKKVLEQSPEDIEVLSKLGDIYSKQKKKKEAADIYIKISDIYLKEKMEDKAKDYYSRAEDLDPAHPTIVERAKKLAEKKAPPPPPPEKEKPVSPPPAPKQAPSAGKEPVEPLPDISGAGQEKKEKPSEKISEMEKGMKQTEQPPEEYTPPKHTEEDVPGLIAMADSYIKAGSFDEGIEFYQKAQELDPKNEQIKKKLNEAYSRYAGVPAPGTAEAEKAQKEKKRKEEEDRKKKEEEERKKKEKEQEEKKKKEEDKKKEAEEEKKKKEKEQEEKKKKEEDKKKEAEEEKKKKEKEQEEKKKKEEEEEEEEFVEEEISDDFVTVTTAEIFVKQGLYSEAQKILEKILKKDPSNIEAKMKLDEISKLISETEEKGKNVKDEENAGKKGKKSRVSYI